MIPHMQYQRALIQIDTGRRAIARPRRWGVRVAVAVLAAIGICGGLWLAR